MSFYRQSFVPAVPAIQQLVATGAVQQPAVLLPHNLHANIQAPQHVPVFGSPESVQVVTTQPQPQYIQADFQARALQVTAQQPNPNLFQQAIQDHGTATALSGDQQVQVVPPSQQSRFAALHNLSSSESSTTSGSSSSSGGSTSSVSGSNLPYRPTYQSMGPHVNIPFDV